MPIVTNVNVHSVVPANGGFKCRASVTVQDNDGASVTEDYHGLWFVNLADVPAIMSERALSSFSEREEALYIREIENGNNPFLNSPKFNTSQELLKNIIKKILSSDDPSERLSYNGIALLNTVTDVQLQNLFPTITAEKITQIRNKVTKMISIKSEFDSYTGMEIE